MSDTRPTEKSNSSSSSPAVSGKAIIAIILSIAALTFVFSNVAPATLRFQFLQFTMPAWGWFLAVLIAGVIIGSMLPWFRPRKK